MASIEVHQTSTLTMRRMMTMPMRDRRRRRRRSHDRAPALEHRVHVAGVDDLDDDDQEERQGAEHVGRDPALGGEHVDLAADLLAGPDEVGQRVQEVGQLAADRLLDADGLHDPVDVADVEALGHALEGVDERVAELGLGHDPGELLGQRRLGLLAHHLDRPQERVAGRQRRGDERQGVGELLLELACGAARCAGCRYGDGRGTGWRRSATTPKSDARR